MFRFQPPPAGQVGGLARFRLAATFASLGVFYLLVRLAASAPGVIAVDLEAEFRLGATETAALIGGMSLVYGLFQVPGSLAIVRFGARRVILAAGLAFVLAAFASAVAPGYGSLLASRLALGACYAPLFPASIAIAIATALAGDGKFAEVSGVLTWLGRLGGVAATAPLALLIAAVGWRASFAWAAGGCLIAALGVAATVARLPAAAFAAPSEAPPPRLRETLKLAGTPGFLGVVLFVGTGTSITSGVLGFWGTGFLKNVYGFELPERSADLLVMAIAWAIAALPWGEASRLFGLSRKPLYFGALIAAVLLAIPAIRPLEPIWLMPWLALLGLASGYYPAALAQAKALLPPSAEVHAIALLSTGSQICVFLGQMASGLILDAFPGRPGEHPPEAYAALLGAWALTMAAAVVLLWRAKAPSS